MKNNVFKLVTLVFCLVLFASVGYAEKTEKAQPSKTTAAIQIKPVETQQTQAQPASAATDKGKQMKWQVVSSGAVEGGTSVTFQLGRNPGYVLSGTVGQLAVGTGSSDHYGINSGYWQEFEECPGRGDATNDGAIDVADVMFLINYLFTGTSAPDPMCNGDATCDGAVDVADVMFLINYLFTGTSPPGC